MSRSTMSASVMQLSNISSSGVLKPSMVANSNCNDSVPEEVKEEFEMNDCRVAIIGNVDAGKSTLIGVLCNGHLDNGKGSARSSVMKHPHEIQSGRTSAVNTEIIGYNENTQVLYNSNNPNHNSIGKIHQRWHHVVSKSDHTLTLIDLCGHEKYFKTTLFGLTGLMPDYAMLVVGSNAGNGIIGMTKEHISMACALELPLIIIITKVDMCPPEVLKQTRVTLARYLRANNKIPFPVKDMQGVDNALKAVGSKPILSNSSDETLSANEITMQHTPVFTVSSVTGVGYDVLHCFLAQLKRSLSRYTYSHDYFKDLVTKLNATEDSTANLNDQSLDKGDLCIRINKGLETVLTNKENNQLPDNTNANAAASTDIAAVVPAALAHHMSSNTLPKILFAIDGVFEVKGVPGLILGGTVMRGVIHPGDVLFLGPQYKTGAFFGVTIRSIECRRVGCSVAKRGQCVTFSVRPVNRKVTLKKSTVRKGMVLALREPLTADGNTHVSAISERVPDNLSTVPIAYRYFEAKVYIMHHATTIGVGYQSVIHCGVLRQAAEIVSITPIQECLSDIEPTMHHLPMKSAQNDETCYSVGQEIIDSIQNEKFVLRTGAKARVIFRFVYTPEYLLPGSTFLFRESKAKGVGKILQTFPDNHSMISSLNIPSQSKNPLKKISTCNEVQMKIIGKNNAHSNSIRSMEARAKHAQNKFQTNLTAKVAQMTIS